MLVGFAAIAAVFAIDLLVPQGVAIGVLYVVAVLAGILSPRRRDTVLLGAASTALAIGAMFQDESVAPWGAVLVNRGLSIVAIWTTVGLVALQLHRRRLADEERERAKERFRTALEAAPDGMLLVDDGGAIRLANRAATRMFSPLVGLLEGRAVEELIPDVLRSSHADARGRWQKAAAAGPMKPGPYTVIAGPSGKDLTLEILLCPLDHGGGTIVSMRDVTERLAFEDRLRTTQRMEAVGKLAGGVAHDFNNLLTVILTSLQFIREGLPEGGQAAIDVSTAQGAAERAAALTAQLLAFSRRQVIAPRVLSLNALILELDKMLRRILGEDVEVVTILADNAWPVEADPSALEQVLMNLVVNARDAMPTGGKLTLETENVVVDADWAKRSPELSVGDYLRLAVSDTGVGMTPDVKARIFEPFFTTKELGMGTGLGLATAYGIVRQAAGHIWVYSEPGKGTTFRIYLPRASGPALPLPRRQERQLVEGGTETILVVEDEPAVRRVTVRTLRAAGYTVHEAANGEDALLRLKQVEGSLALLLTDVVMPQMGGRQLAERVTETHPEAMVIYMSGYTENAIVHQGTLKPDIVFLQKPFLPEALLRRVREVLDRRLRG